MALAVSALKYNYVSIQNPDSGKKAIDLTNHLLHTEYFEDLLSPIITMKMRIRSEFNYIAKVPIRGGEMIAFSAEVGGTTFQFGEIDSNGNIKPNSGELYVYKLSDLSQPSQAQDFQLNITSLEFIKNETSRCQKKFKPQTIDKHVREILGNVMNVNPDKILDKNIEETENTYTFIGNNRKPFYTIEWLCPKSITNSVQGVSGDGGSAQGKGTAGFLFYENREGFNFKSVESLVRSTTLKSNNKKAKKTSQEALNNLYNLQNELSMIQQQFQNETVSKMAAKLEKIMRDFLFLSKKQENLKEKTSLLSRNSSRLKNMAYNQQLIQDQLRQKATLFVKMLSNPLLFV